MMREALERSAVESERASAIYAACADTADAEDPYRLAEFQVRAGRFNAAIDSLLGALRIGIHTVAVDQSLQLYGVVSEMLDDISAPANDPRRGVLREAHVTLLRLGGSIPEAKQQAGSLAEDAAAFGWKRVRGDAHVHLGILAEQLGEPTRAVLRHFDEALATFDELDDDRGRARAYRALAQYHLAHGKPDVSSNLTQKALELLRSAGDPEGVVDCLAALGTSRLQEGSLERSRSRFEEARTRAEELGLRHFTAEAMLGLGQIAWRQGASSQAERHFRDALELWTSIGSHSSAIASAYVGLMHLERLELAAARRAFERALPSARAGAAPRVARLVEAGMMAASANDSAPDRFDEHFRYLAEHHGELSGMETPNAVFLAGQLWARNGDRDRARRAYDFARNQFLAIGAQKRADDVARAIGRLNAR
jgi:tetratricopeptide (TPR) repeat protein